MGLLWPDKDEEQARHLLSAGVHEIRKELGESVLVTRGDDLVLDPSVMVTDLDQFRAAIDEGDPQAAVDLYAGPFLDGFFIDRSPEFHHWMEAERDEVARAFRRALEDVAEHHEGRGELDAAVDAWRRVVVEDRYDSRVALRLLHAFAAAGNHAGALQFARVHRALLSAELETTPTPEFSAAVAAIREAGEARSAPPATPEHSAGPDEAHLAVGVAPPGPTLEAPVDTAGKPARTRDPRSIALVITLVMLAAVAMTVGAVLQGRLARPVVGPTTIAVLPFEHGNGVDESFAHGLTEEVLGVLGAVDGVRVPVWSAAASLGGVDARTAAASLGVDHVLEGTIRREEDMLRVRVWLSDAEGMQVWTGRYDRPEGPVFQAHDDIAQAVLSAIEVKLDIARGVLSALDVDLQADAVRPLEGGTMNPVAYDQYLRGRHAWYRRTPDGFAQALVYFQNAVALDDGYARAHAGLADTYNMLGDHIYGLLPPDSAFPRARRSAERAVELAPRLAQGHLALAQNRGSYDRDWAGAEASFHEAIRLDPNYPEAHHWYSLLLVATGRPAEAMAAARRAVALDSVSPHTHANMGRLLYYLGDYEAAEGSFQRALSLDAGTVPAHLGLGLVWMAMDRLDEAAALFAGILDAAAQPSAVGLALLGHALGRAGRTEEARATLGRLENLRRSLTYVPPEYLALIHVGLSDLDRAVEGLENAFRAGSAAVVFMTVDPVTIPLREHTRFQQLAREVGL